MTNHLIKSVSQLTKENSKFNLYGIHGTATAGATTNIDGQLPQERWVEGGRLVLTNHAAADRVTLQIVAKPGNPLGLPDGYVLGEHATNAAVIADQANQDAELVPYIALVQPWMAIRIAYTSTGQQNVAVSLNLRTHIPNDI